MHVRAFCIRSQRYGKAVKIDHCRLLDLFGRFAEVAGSALMGRSIRVDYDNSIYNITIHKIVDIIVLCHNIY